jgi:hypothetical protein
MHKITLTNLNLKKKRKLLKMIDLNEFEILYPNLRINGILI